MYFYYMYRTAKFLHYFNIFVTIKVMSVVVIFHYLIFHNPTKGD